VTSAAPLESQFLTLMAIPLHSFPPLIASLNAASAVLLVAGYFFIRAKRVAAHRACMLTAFVCSIAFLVFYLYFHLHAGIIRFGGQGSVRPVYFTLLISHTILAAIVPVLVIVTLTFAILGRFDKHRRIARWTLPLWLYVSLTGVVIYWILYVAYTPIGAPA
jgi:putative membrane protein